MIKVRQKATDCLLNAETVKLYSGEAFERETFRAKILDFQHHEWYSLASLGALNTGQAVVITVGKSKAIVYPPKPIGIFSSW